MIKATQHIVFMLLAILLASCVKTSATTPTEIAEKLTSEVNPTATLLAHNYTVESLAFSPDGAVIATGSERVIRLWDISEGKVIGSLEGHLDSVRSIAFSADGKYIVSGSLDGSIKVWDYEKIRLQYTIRADPQGVISVAVSPDSRFISASASSEGAGLWDTETGRAVLKLSGSEEGPASVAFSHNNKWLATEMSNNSIMLWERTDYTLYKELSGHQFPVYGIAFSPDDAIIASASMDDTVKMWRTAAASSRPTPIFTLRGHTDSVYSVAFSPGGKTLATAGMDGQVILWDVETGYKIQSLTVNAVLSPVTKFSPDGTILAATGDRGVYLWSIPVALIGPITKPQVTTVPANPVTLRPTNTTIPQPTTTITAEGSIINGGNLRTEPIVQPTTVIGQVCPEDEFIILERAELDIGLWYKIQVIRIDQNCNPNRVAANTIGWVNSLLTQLR